MKLEDHHEIVGLLTEIESKDGITKLQFSIHKIYEIPTDGIDTKKLQSLIGERVGIFNCSGNYRTRRVKKFTKSKETK